MSNPEDRLREEIEAKGVSSLARALGIARNTLYNWCEKGNVPLDKLFALGAEGVDVDYVLTGTRRELRQMLNDVRIASEEAAEAAGDSVKDYAHIQESRFAERQAARAVSQPETPMSDRARLVAAISAVEEGLAETRRKLPPDKRAELILAAYDLMAEPQQSRSNVIRMVRAVAA